MNMPRPSGRQRAIAALAAHLAASSLLLGVLLTFDPAILSALLLPASA